MTDIIESICAFVLVLIVAGFMLWLRYIQADKNIYCMFDASPRACAILIKNNK